MHETLSMLLPLAGILVGAKIAAHWLASGLPLVLFALGGLQGFVGWFMVASGFATSPRARPHPNANAPASETREKAPGSCRRPHLLSNFNTDLLTFERSAGTDQGCCEGREW